MTNLVNIIGKNLTQSRKSNYKSKPAFKPSQMGSDCIRKLYYAYLRVDEDFEFPANVKKIMKLGEYIHLLISDVLRKEGVLVDYHNKDGSVPKSKSGDGTPDLEFPLKDEELEVSAKIDGVLKLSDGLWLGEWKSISDSQFKSLRGPKPDHIIQGCMYLYLFNKALKEGKYSHIKALEGYTEARGVRFLYYNKGNSEMLEFIYTDLQLPFSHTVQKILNVKSHIENNTLPEKKVSSECSGCPWRLKCVSNLKIDLQNQNAKVELPHEPSN